MSVVVRFAPSPTGLLHAGNISAALFDRLFARRHDGKFILRLDKTDRGHGKPEFESAIERDLSRLIPAMRRRRLALTAQDNGPEMASRLPPIGRARARLEGKAA